MTKWRVSALHFAPGEVSSVAVDDGAVVEGPRVVSFNVDGDVALADASAGDVGPSVVRRLLDEDFDGRDDGVVVRVVQGQGQVARVGPRMDVGFFENYLVTFNTKSTIIIKVGLKIMYRTFNAAS